MMNELAKEIHANNVAHGFYQDEKNIGEMLCLIHSEVSEALEADRHNKYVKESKEIFKLNEFVRNDLFKGSYDVHIKGTFEEEMADIIIRVLDMCTFKGIDIEAHVKAKMRYNSLREFMHGKKY